MLAGLSVYLHALGAPWYFDDYLNIVDNAKIKDLAEASKEIISPRGLAYFSFAVDYHFWGLSPTAFRITNLILHLAGAGVVYLLVIQLVKKSSYGFWAGLIFAVHPLQTQATTYIVQRMTLLAGLFFLLAVLFYCLGRQRLSSAEDRASGAGWLFLLPALVSGLLSVLCKENTAVLPLILLLIEYLLMEPGQQRKKRVLYLVPFLLVPLFGLVLRLASTEGSLQAFNYGIEYFAWAADGSGRVVVDYHPDNLRVRYLATQAIVIWEYIGLCFRPLKQALDYCYPLVSQLFNWASICGALGLGALAALGWRLRRARPVIAFGIGWFLLLLLVESSVIPLDPFFEHRLYLPLIGVVLIVVDVVVRFLSPRLTAIVLTLLVAGSMQLTWQRNALWNDKIAFWQQNVSVRSFAYRPFANLGKALLNNDDLTGAKAAFEQVVRLHPESAEGHVNLGILLDKLGQGDRAVLHLQKALTLPGENDRASYNLGVHYELAGDYRQAREYYRRAVQLAPDNYRSYFGLGVVNYHLGELSASLQRFRVAKQLAPQEPKVIYNHASVALEAGQFAEARAALPVLKRLHPEYYRQLSAALAAEEKGE